MTGALLVLTLVLCQVEVVEEPDAYLTVVCRTKTAKVYIDGCEAGLVNKKLPVTAGTNPLRITIAQENRWDIHYEVPIKKGKHLRLRVVKMHPGISMLDGAMDMKTDFRTWTQHARGVSGTYKVIVAPDQVEVVGDPLDGSRFQLGTDELAKKAYYVLRVEYVIDAGSGVEVTSVFGIGGTNSMVDGKPHTFILVVGKTNAWSLVDYKRIITEHSLNPEVLRGIGFRYKPGAKGRFVVRRVYLKEIDKTKFVALSKTYGQPVGSSK